MSRIIVMSNKSSAAEAQSKLNALLFALTSSQVLVPYLTVSYHIEWVLSDSVVGIRHEGRCVTINPDFILNMDLGERLYWLVHCCLHLVLCHGVAYFPQVKHLRESGKKVNSMILSKALDVYCDRVASEDAQFLIRSNASTGGKRLEIKIPQSRLQALEVVVENKADDSVLSIFNFIAAHTTNDDTPSPEEHSAPPGTANSDTDGSGTPPTPDSADVQDLQDLFDSFNAQRTAGQESLGGGRPLFAAQVQTIQWHQVFAELFRDHVRGRGTDTSWAKPSRRALARGVYLPGRMPVPNIGELIVVFDTSCSISDKEIAEAASHVQDIVTETPPERVRVLWVDAEVCGEQVFEPDMFPTLRTALVPCGGGGTDMRAALTYVRVKGYNVCGMVIFTDLYTPFPKQLDGYPVWWVSASRHMTAPTAAGVTIHI